MACRRPAMQIYPGDWYRDPVAGLSLEAQGLWFRLMFIMHDSEPYGELRVCGKPMSDEMAASLCGKPIVVYRRALKELEDAGVPGRRDDGAIYSRRMVKDEDERRKAAERMRNSRRTSAQHKTHNGATTAEHEDEVEEEESLSCDSSEGDARGRPETGPWAKPKRVHHDPAPAGEIVPVGADFAAVNELLRDFLNNASEAFNLAKHPNATLARVRWAIADAKRRIADGEITPRKAVGFVVWAIKNAKDETPGPAVETPDARRRRVLAEQSAKLTENAA